VELAAQSRLPAIYSGKEYAEAGGLMAYGTNIRESFRRAATYVDKILKAAKPGDLPIEQPTKFELVINMKAAKALGLTIPPTLLLRADQVIATRRLSTGTPTEVSAWTDRFARLRWPRGEPGRDARTSDGDTGGDEGQTIAPGVVEQPTADERPDRAAETAARLNDPEDRPQARARESGGRDRGELRDPHAEADTGRRIAHEEPFVLRPSHCSEACDPGDCHNTSANIEL